MEARRTLSNVVSDLLGTGITECGIIEEQRSVGVGKRPCNSDDSQILVLVHPSQTERYVDTIGHKQTQGSIKL